MNPILIGIIVLFVCLALSAPVAVSAGLCVIAIWLAEPGLITSPSYIFQAIVTSLDVYALLAVPLFVLSGLIMAKGGISKKLFNFFAYFVGNFPGGMPCTVVITCLFYGALSGSGPATVAAVGAMTIPILVDIGYELSFATALICVSGGLGVIIPPSIPFIMYGQSVNASIGDMFVAGILPGLLIGFCLMAYCVFYAKTHGEDKAKIAENTKKLRSEGFFAIFKESFWALLTPVIILGGIYGGVFTPTEAAGISVVYSLFVSIVIYKTMTLKQIPKMLARAAQTVSTQLYIVGVCAAFARALVLMHLTDQLSAWMITTFHGKFGILLCMNLIMLILGCLMDTTAAITMAAPILYPIAASVGVNIIHFGIIMVVNLAIGFVTPPVGANLNVAHSLSGVPIPLLARKALPFLLMFFVALLMITFIPGISLALL